MLHEILLALLGHPGNLIIKSELHFEINPLITFLSSAEKDLINRILPLGSHYQSLLQILTRIHKEEACFESQGLYLKALAQGIEEILDGYKEIILEIERDFLENRVFTLSLLALKLNKYTVFLKEIEEFLQGVIKENVKGAQIIDAIMRKKTQSNQLVNEIYEVLLKYCYQILYNQHIIEKLRSELGADLLDLLLKKEDFPKYLSEIKTFYLMEQGLFFQIFSEESKSLMQLPPKSSSESDLNAICLQNTLMRLNLEEDKTLKRVSFCIKSQGFEYNNFTNLTGLRIFGGVQQKNSSMLHFEPIRSSLQTSAIWYPLKQNLENGFKVTFLFRFKRVSQIKPTGPLSIYSKNSESLASTELEAQSFAKASERRAASNTSLCFVLQNSKEPSEYSKNLKDFPEFVSVKFTISEEEPAAQRGFTEEKTKCFVQVATCANSQEITVLQKELSAEKASFFAEEDLVSVEIQYNNENLEIFLGDQAINNKSEGMEIEQFNENQENSNHIKVALKLSKCLALEMGKGYVGFVQESRNSLYGIDFLSWKMVGYNILNNEDPWNGLTVSYRVDWPLNLIISSVVVEKFTNIFRFLFPIRNVQLDLQKTWLNFMQKERKLALKTEIKGLILLRNQMGLVIENLWSYFHLDVFQVQWSKLQEKFTEIKDFEEMRKGIDEYLSSISNQLFLHFPKIVKFLFEIVNIVKSFVNLLNRMEYGGDLPGVLKGTAVIRQKFEDNFLKLVNLLALLNKNYSSPFLYQLLLRLDYNNFYLNPLGNPL